MFRALSHPKKQRYAQKQFDSFFSVPLKTSAGIYLGNVPAYQVDGPRLQRVLGRYVRALHYIKRGTVPPIAWLTIDTDPERAHYDKDLVLSVINGSEVNVVQKNTFSYAWQPIPDRPEASVWFLEFYNGYGVLGFVRPPDVTPA